MMATLAVMMFHPRTGDMVSLTNGNRTAQRNQPAQEYNNGLVLSLETLKDNQLFEVRIDKKINSWTGAIAIGVTTSDPLTMEFPSSVVDLRESWFMSGTSILKDGKMIVEDYGQNLDSLDEGNRVGVMKNQGDLYFYINGVSLGVAATGLPNTVRAVVDLYGKCCQITVVEFGSDTRHTETNVTVPYEHLPSVDSNFDNGNVTDSNNIANGNNGSFNRLRFHERTGSLVVLANNGRTAERRRPFDEFNNGVVMTHRTLRNNELFEIRIDRLVDKWSGSIEVGVTTHSPASLQFPATMTNMRSGTIMMSGCGILTNGKGTRREYGDYNLDELSEGDRIGLMRKSDGSLNYYINGMDQGVAATNVPATVFGVVDLYGMTVKVTIVERDDRIEQGLANHRNNTLIREYQLLNREYQLLAGTDFTDRKFETDIADKLLFHRRCGKHVTVVNSDRTAQRPSPVENFDNAVVLTSRPLKANEVFEVQLDVVVNKWMGSLEIGVTTHNPNELEFPSTMTNIKSGTWMMTGNGIMHNGAVILEEYGQNLDLLHVGIVMFNYQSGDHVSVVRKQNGALHFYVNGSDQGLAAINVPDGVYGAIDLFGQAAQATIVEHNDSADDSLDEGVCERLPIDLCFHHLHGRNARITSNGRTASRPNALSEFNDAIVISNRPLNDGEMFEVILDKMVDRWSGSIEAGVTAIKPEDLVFPSTMTDIDYDTWMLSGSAIMQDGLTIRNGYKCDLDVLTAGMRIGMMRCADATLHYFINGDDMGVACSDIPTSVYAVIDLYGQCAQVTIVSPSSSSHSCLSDSAISPQTHTETLRASVIECLDITHCFSPLCGKNVTLSSNGMVASRTRGFNHGIVFGGSCLQPNELFEVQIQKINPVWSGSLRIGLTTLRPSETYCMIALPTHAAILSTGGDTWLVAGNKVLKNGHLLQENYGISLEWLDVGDRVGIKRCADGTLHVFRNGEDAGVAAADLPKGVYVVLDLYGSVEKVSIVSKVILPSSSLALYIDSSRERRLSVQSEHSRDSLERDAEELTVHELTTVQDFHDNHGRNIVISENFTHARRVASYNNGIVFSRKPLQRGQLFQVRIERLNSAWTSSLIIGVIAHAPDKQPQSVTAFGLRKPFWLICSDNVFHNGLKVKGRYTINLDRLQVRQTVGVLVDIDCCLHLYINGVDQGIACTDISPKCYAVIDLYGQCEEIRICSDSGPLCSDHCEKADLEHKLKEKPLWLPVGPKYCEYQRVCIQFKWNLGLPEAYFMNDACMCYCDNCYKFHADVAYQRKGEPPRDYSVPFGWCQFRLKLPSKDEISGITEKWHVAFHGTHPSIIRRILDNNELVLPEDASLCASTKRKSLKNKSKDADVEANQICFSPTIRYAANNYLTPKFEFLDAKTKRKLFARTVFQVLVQPGSYNSGPQRVGAREPIDCHFSNNDIEWLTKEKGAIILHSLLIRIENL